MTDRLPHNLRSDARDNRERILAAARTLFAAEGLDVPMRAVARRAGVSPATLYRRFPTKQDLAAEAFAEQARLCRAHLDQARADPDAWHGFRLLIERIFEMHARDRGFTDAFLATYPDSVDFAAERTHALKAVAELARRAKAVGRLRRDFAVEDLFLVLMALRGVDAPSAPARAAAARRFAALVVRSFEAAPGNGPLPPVPDLAPLNVLRFV
ncbi:TetR/AcrR family transcriptional regulator [Nocardiopsis suaedae]|uniref:Helix-turn-helix domain containing protein n=1 Tax=Nocardiopsis suaedae TaxID=3018444 RepID=A0ABT4TH84_9ACTN|nr:TetR/AcrR family transcriptional regulator [Nocardiopsis suaedae]MDA2804078.1 helix-turn-helix domain containing protein [Nocardiopsis suaedae]